MVVVCIDNITAGHLYNSYTIFDNCMCIDNTVAVKRNQFKSRINKKLCLVNIDFISLN